MDNNLYTRIFTMKYIFLFFLIVWVENSIAQSMITVAYKSIDTTVLTMDIYYPEDFQSDQTYPAIVFYFGGGWVGGTKQHFKPQAEFFARRGMICFTPEYRIAGKHGTPPQTAIEDARSAMRWVRQHTDSLRIDSQKIVAAGGSAGGHLALCTALISDFDSPEDPLSVEPTPSALLLFNPVVNTTSEGYGAEKLGADTLKASPYHNIVPEMPPTMIFHGTADQVVPYSNVKALEERMEEMGNYCKLVPFEGRGHGFFNKGRGSGLDYLKTLVKADKFLRVLGYLGGA